MTFSCNRSANTARNTPDAFQRPVPLTRYADDLGRFLAGLPARSGSAVAGAENNEAWAEHRRESDREWSGIERDSLPAMRVFQKSELSGALRAGASVFYPFSGPDTLTVTTFFPGCPTYVMVGLEPAGTLPSPQKLVRKDLDKYLKGVRATLASELGRSFFITSQMDRQLRGQITDGLFLPILELLVRTNHTILGYRYVRLNESGRIVQRAFNYKALARSAIREWRSTSAATMTSQSTSYSIFR